MECLRGSDGVDDEMCQHECSSCDVVIGIGDDEWKADGWLWDGNKLVQE